MNAELDLVAQVRSQFPGLDQDVHGKPLIYLDNAASSQMCVAAIEAVDHFARHDRSNVHRGAHELGQRATQAMEDARAVVQRFIGAAHEDEIVFTRGTTDSINLVAGSLGAMFSAGDEVVITEMEHHSNIVPWQLLAARAGIKVRVAAVDDRGVLDLDGLIGLIGPRTRLVSVAHVSNSLGTVNPVGEIIDAAHDRGVPVLLDGAQAIPHVLVDVASLDVDLYAFSGHKVFAPNGIGVLYGKRELLRTMPPYQGGGEMIDEVSFEGTTFAEPPARFEAGTPNVSGIVGLGAALSWLMSQDRAALAAHEHALVEAADAMLAAMPGIRRIGTAPGKQGACSFVMEGVPGADVGTLLDMQGIAVRTGHHCTQPLMRRFGIDGTVRASFSFYNTMDEVEALERGLHKVRRMVGGA